MTDTGETLRRASAVVAEVLGLDCLALGRATRIAEVDGWDSIAMVQIMVGLEQEFGIRFRTGDMAGLETVGALLDRIEEQGRKS